MLKLFKSRWQVSLAFAAALLLAALPLLAECFTYSNSRPAYISGQSVCAYTGSGCTECSQGDGGSCITDGASCEPFVRSPNA